MSAPHRVHRTARAAGFTLIELVMVMAILAILAGAAVPVASRYFDSRGRASTRTELDALSRAALEYFRDTGRLPAAPSALIQDPGLAGWTGPYVSVSSDDPWSGANDALVDAWARSYRFQGLGTAILELRSAGEGAVFGDADDIVFQVDGTPVLREKTLDQLRAINTAITRYNASNLPDAPLSTRYGRLLSRLVQGGYLPSKAPYARDAWGTAFVADPAGKSPVVAVTSTHLR